MSEEKTFDFNKIADEFIATRGGEKFLSDWLLEYLAVKENLDKYLGMRLLESARVELKKKPAKEEKQKPTKVVLK